MFMMKQQATGMREQECTIPQTGNLYRRTLKQEMYMKP